MFWILVSINTVLYGLYCYLGYIDSIKELSWFVPICLLIVLVGNDLWLFYVKTISDTSTIFISGIIWDALLTSSFVLVPYIFFNVKLGRTSLLGLLICIVGLALLKTRDFLEKKMFPLEDRSAIRKNHK